MKTIKTALAVAISLTWLVSCGVPIESDGVDNGRIYGGKGELVDLTIPLVPESIGRRGKDGESSTFVIPKITIAGAFSVELVPYTEGSYEPSSRYWVRLKVEHLAGGGTQETKTISTGDLPLLQVAGSAEASSYRITVSNRSQYYWLRGFAVRIRSGEATPPTASLPKVEVLFTEPLCKEVVASDGTVLAEAGQHCYGGQLGHEDDKEPSREQAGIVKKLNAWIDQAREAKEANPSRDVKITMAYLTWSDGRTYEAICKATAAGVKFEGFFDQQSAGSQPPKLATDSACKASQNVEIRYLGGRTDAQKDWRLMHIKMIIIDTGDASTKIVFGSANASSYATSIHFENWVFAEVASDSHFAQAHRCAAEALKADSYEENGGSFKRLFAERYSDCIDDIVAKPDPKLSVYFSPDPQKTARDALRDAIEGAKSSVDMAIQHFSEQVLARRLRDAGRDNNVRARLVVDDDTFYDDGESGGVDYATYKNTLKDEGIDIKFIQSNGYLTYGKQYQHNKYVIIDNAAVFCGAGNFTSVAFGSAFGESAWRANYENFYFIRLPEVVAQYKAHFERLHGLGRSAAALPDDPNF